MPTSKRNIILGIDPGSRITGYAVIWIEGSQQGCLRAGCIRTQGNNFAERLAQIHAGICSIIDEHQPNEAAIEEVFVRENIQSALKLGQARGAAIVAIASAHIPLAEYSPRKIKQAATGYGAATKAQIQHMMKTLFNLPETPQPDAADALAIALCHANHACVSHYSSP